MSAWSMKSMPWSRAVRTRSRISSSVFSAIRMRPRTTAGALIPAPGIWMVFTRPFWTRRAGPVSDPHAAGPAAQVLLPAVGLRARGAGDEVAEADARGQGEPDRDRAQRQRGTGEHVAGVDDREHRPVDRQPGQHRGDA